MLLDFLFLAQFQSYTSKTLSQMKGYLAAFHNNKAVFVDLGIRKNFNIPKFHSMLHYISSIHLFGTMDNYNTKLSEQLHIDLAKNAFCVTNHKDKYAQMTTWLEHCKKVHQHSASNHCKMFGLGPRLDPFWCALNSSKCLKLPPERLCLFPSFSGSTTPPCFRTPWPTSLLTSIILGLGCMTCTHVQETPSFLSTWSGSTTI